MAACLLAAIAAGPPAAVAAGAAGAAGAAAAGIPTAAAPALGAAPAGAADPLQVPRWDASQIHLYPAQAEGNGGQGVVVAVLDTWIDAAHPDFGGRVLPGANCVTGTCHPGGTTTPDGCEAHGTHVAGIVASASYGVAPRATILPVEVLAGSSPQSCAANSTAVAQAVYWAAAHGAQVINLSLGNGHPVHGQITALAQAVDTVSVDGVIVVAAAGNQLAPVGDSYGSDAVVVAATGPTGQLASYSQRGSGVALAAPGGDPGNAGCTIDDCVVSTWAGGAFAALAGTSMAAPQVAGLAALLLGRDPQLGRAGVLAAIEGTARPLAAAGFGLIDADAALAAVTPAPTPRVTPPTTGQAHPPASAGVPTAEATQPPPSIGAALSRRRRVALAAGARTGPGGAGRLLVAVVAAALAAALAAGVGATAVHRRRR